MQAAAYVDQACELAGKMVAREMRGPGDIENAMRRIETRHGIPYQSLWALRYRRPKEIAAHVYAGIVTAYFEECDRQERILRHEREAAEAKTLVGKAFIGAGAALSRAADAVDGQDC